MVDNKIEELKNYVLQYRFSAISNDLFVAYDKLIKLCVDEKDYDNLCFAYYYLAEIYFRQGKDDKAIDTINLSLTTPRATRDIELEIRSYNLLGLIYYAKGNELSAYSSYSSALSLADDYPISRCIVNVNIGNLFKDLEDYETALTIFHNAYDALKESSEEFTDYDIECILNSYCGICYFMMNDIEKGIEYYNRVEELTKGETATFYNEAIENLKICAYHFTNNKEKLYETFNKLVANLKMSDDFFELAMFYINISFFVLKHGYSDILRQIIDGMKIKITHCENIYLNFKIAELEAEYQKNFGTEEEYNKACHHYHDIVVYYNPQLKQSKAKSILNYKELNDARDAQEELIKINRLDSMTKIYNKRYLTELINSHMATLPDKAALMVIDIDDFKQVNDNYGHLTGDEVIMNVAECIKYDFPYEIYGRIGGDEFVVYFKNFFDDDNLTQRIDAFLNDIKHLSFSDKISISISCGVALIGKDMKNYNDIFATADKALYCSKANGKARCYVIKNADE